MNTQITMYGIKNCDAIKKARKWLDEIGVDYHFHDYRVDGLEIAQLKRFIEQLGWEILLNTRGTTWRQLTEEQHATVNNAATAAALMLEQPTLIKRPLLVTNEQMLLGFKISEYQQFIAKAK